MVAGAGVAEPALVADGLPALDVAATGNVSLAGGNVTTSGDTAYGVSASGVDVAASLGDVTTTALLQGGFARDARFGGHRIHR